MFERYTETARKTVVCAKHEADRFGSREVCSEHILLALLNDASLVKDTMDGVSETELREAITAYLPRGEIIHVKHDLPLSAESRQVLIFAAEEAEGFGHRYIGNEHLPLGLMRSERGYVAGLLKQKGLSTAKLRSRIAGAEA
jgi:ATP-dependent Clp protease ATP-binding subunit ClpC